MLATRRRAPRIDTLSQIDLFRGCSSEELAVIAGLTTPIDIRAGHVLCREGSVGREAMVIVAGDASVTIDGLEIARVGPGDICGEMALLDQGIRSATVTSLSPMTVLALSAREFERLVTDAPTVARRMLSALSKRLRTAQTG